MLFYPWYNESTDLLADYSTYEEHYYHVKQTVVDNEQKYTLADIEGLEIDENNIPDHAWNHIAPNTESTQAQSRAQGSEQLTDVSQEDIDNNANLFTSTNSGGSLHARFETAASKQEIPPSQYRELVRGLNAKQRQMVMYHRRWCKNAVLALK